MVCDFPGTRRTFDDQILPAKRVDQCAMLRAVGIPDQMWDVFLMLVRIDRVLLGEVILGLLRAFKQFAHERVLGNALAGRPGLRDQDPGTSSSLPKLRSASVICRRMDQRFLSFRMSANFAK
jgi:hypothetical protein